jgi:hypothetical protein
MVRVSRRFPAFFQLARRWNPWRAEIHQPAAPPNPNCAVIDYTEMELTGTGKNCNLKWRRQRGNG